MEMMAMRHRYPTAHRASTYAFFCLKLLARASKLARMQQSKKILALAGLSTASG